jgi:hypothetical protein
MLSPIYGRLVVPILYGAVAYREDLLEQFANEIASWDLERVYEHPIVCPKGNACDKVYRLILEVNASEETAKEYVDIVLHRMEQEPCESHVSRIRINPPM